MILPTVSLDATTVTLVVYENWERYMSWQHISSFFGGGKENNTAEQT
jgi:hypothetical protein